MRADDIRKDQMRYKEIEPNGISPNSTALAHDQPLWLGHSKPRQPKMEVTPSDFFQIWQITLYILGGQLYQVAGHWQL